MPVVDVEVLRDAAPELVDGVVMDVERGGEVTSSRSLTASQPDK